MDKRNNLKICDTCGAETEYPRCPKCYKLMKTCPLCDGRVIEMSELHPGSDGPHDAPVFSCRKCNAEIRYDYRKHNAPEARRKFAYNRPSLNVL